MHVIDIAVFAHNEAAGIGAMLEDLCRQSLLRDPGADIRLVVLANGCSDDTVSVARAALARHSDVASEVLDLPEPGKSRTWTAFVHRHARPEAEFFLLCDADIGLPDAGTLAGLVAELVARPQLQAMSSRPVKDIVYRPEGLSPVQKLIAASAGTLDDWRSGICGQLYILRAARARRIAMPIGLPVEDGFLRAMVLTDLLTVPEDLSRIDGRDTLFHLYESERTLGALLRHQTRIVVGSAINALIFRRIAEMPVEGRDAALAEISADPDWVGALLKERLPRWPFGWVPGHFLFKRLAAAARPGAPRLTVKRAAIVAMGFGFDAVVYVMAQLRMARGQGAGFW